MVERLEAHPQSPSARFAKYVHDLKEAALRSADERAKQDRKEHADTEYNRVGLYNEGK